MAEVGSGKQFYMPHYRVMLIALSLCAMSVWPKFAAASLSEHSSPCATTDMPTQSTSAAYGEDLVLQTLDLYTPKNVTDEPIVLFVHGGGWIQGDKTQYAALGRAFARCGVAFAAIDYRLAPSVTVSQQAMDVARAIRWLLNIADSTGFSKSKLFLMGHSAGAELAAFTATDQQALSMAAISKQTIAGVIAMDGTNYNPTVEAIAAQTENLALSKLAFGANTADWTQYDIGRRLEGDEPPFLVVHGQHDDVVSNAAPRLLVKQLRAAGDQVMYLQPDRDHMTVVADMMNYPNDPTLLAITRFVSSGSLLSI